MPARSLSSLRITTGASVKTIHPLPNTCPALLLAVALALATPALAGPGHDHGDEGPTAGARQALPRFSATSELFEIVGVVAGTRLTVYLDRAPTNEPVPDAKLDIEVAGRAIPIEPRGKGVYEATLAAPLGPGVHAVSATVVAGADTDLLAGELDLHEDAHDDAATAGGWRRYMTMTTGAIGAAVVVGLGLFAALRRRMTGGAA